MTVLSLGMAIAPFERFWQARSSQMHEGGAMKALTMGRPAPPEHGDQWIDNRARKAQDEAFCDALAYAWKQRLENPPMIGIDTRPCTANPIYVPRREQQPPGQSVGSEL